MTSDPNARTVANEKLADAVLSIFSREEIPFLPERPFRDFVFMVARRLDKAGPPPTVDELEGLREIAFEHLWHPAIDRAVTAQRRNHSIEGSDTGNVAAETNAFQIKAHGVDTPNVDRQEKPSGN